MINTREENSNHSIFNFHKTADHSYASPENLKLNHEDDDLQDIDYSSIFDSHGNWQEKHKRSIINVIDSYGISHEAYHELRLARKGHFPPLYKIINEKKIMSAEIEFIRHPTVIQLFGIQTSFAIEEQTFVNVL